MNLTLLAIIGIVIMLILILSGANIGLCMIITGILGYAVVRDWNGALTMVKTYLVSNSMSYSMTVIPLFVLMGQFAFYSGISDDLFNSTRIWFGKKSGGMAYAGVVSCGLFGAICGSLAATTATMSKVAYPIMKKHNYKDEIIGGTMASAGVLGPLIPPSTPFILYGLTTSVSIGKLFAAGILPGIVQALCFCIVIAIWCRRDKELCPAGESYPIKEKLKALKGFLGMAVLFALVLGGMFSGLCSVTEAAALGCTIAFIILLVRRRFTWSSFKTAVLETISTTGMVMINVVGAGIFGCFLTVTGLPQALANWVLANDFPGWLVILVILVVFAVFGCIMDTLALMLLAVPIFLPLLQALGFDLIWFGALIVMIMNLGAVTPPVGLSCYVAAGVMNMPLNKVFKGAAPFLLGIAGAILVVAFIPALSTWLPSFMS
ncbi:MAG: TRAP transporter large permease [Parasporobacterium sp.]|nr:TRAP transporter large permease [Parasporobacterium sp.]